MNENNNNSFDNENEDTNENKEVLGTTELSESKDYEKSMIDMGEKSAEEDVIITPPPLDFVETDQKVEEPLDTTPPPLPNSENSKKDVEDTFNAYTFNEQKLKQAKVKTGKKTKGVFLVATMIILSLVVGLGGGYFGSMLYLSKVDKSNTINTVINTSDTTTVAGAVSKVASPSVVEIQTETITKGGYFGQYTSQGAGSGVIYSEDGYIITNNHVIEGASNIQVYVKSNDNLVGDMYEAKLIGTDAKNDLAILKISAKGLTPAIIGSSSELQLGDFVLAIGNPLGSLGGTVTDGIISALDREIEVDGSLMRLLQTNAAVNPGNSGGGLFNSKGELVGVVNAKSSGTDVEGLGFAIPINTAIPIVEDLIENGSSSSSSKDDDKLVLGIDVKQDKKGILIENVKEGSLAEESGFKEGDIIYGTSDTRLTKLKDLSDIMDSVEAGDKLTFKVMRDGKSTSIKVQF